MIGPPLLWSHFHSRGGSLLSHGYPWRRSSGKGSMDAPYNGPPLPPPSLPLQDVGNNSSSTKETLLGTMVSIYKLLGKPPP